MKRKRDCWRKKLNKRNRYGTHNIVTNSKGLIFQSLVLSNPRFTLDAGEVDEGGDIGADESKEIFPLAPVVSFTHSITLQSCMLGL